MEDHQTGFAKLAVKIFRADPWGERIATGTLLDVEVREPGTKHSITLVYRPRRN